MSVGSVSKTTAAITPSTSPSLEGLQRGSRGPDVMELQKQLNAHGAKLEVDGRFGPLTEAALKKFQASAGSSGSGRVDAGTVAALQVPPQAKTPAPTTPSTTTTRASSEVQQGARARTAADEGRIKAQLGDVPTTAKTATATTTTTTTQEGHALSPEQVQTVLGHIETGKRQVAEEKAVIGQVKEALQREVGELEQPVAGATRTVADEAVLAGRRGQLEAVTKAEEVVDLKARGYDAAATAVKDGVLTETEVKSLATVADAVQKSEVAIQEHTAAATSLVERGLKAGGRGSPSLGLRKPEAPASPPSGGTALAKADIDVATERIQQALAGVRAEKEALASAKPGLQAEVKTLEALKNRTPADDAVLAGRKAQLELLGKANEHLDIRVAGLEAAARAIGDGVLTEDEAKNLATIDTSLSAAEQQIAAQAGLAAELVHKGLAAGGRGSPLTP